MRDGSLMLAMFFLPFGYDYLFKIIMDLTGSYWTADMIFYGISIIFFTIYIMSTLKLKKLNK